MEDSKSKRNAKKREKLSSRLLEMERKSADLQEEQRKIKEEKRKIQKEYEENERLYLMEIVESFQVTTDELTTALNNFVKLRDNPAQNGTTPVQTAQAVIGTATQKSTTEKEKSYDEEID